MSKTTFEDVQVGDKVYLFLFDKFGTVSSRSNTTFTVEITKDEHYTCGLNGSPWASLRCEQVVFWDKPVFEVPTQPERLCKPKAGQLVLITNRANRSKYIRVATGNNTDKGVILLSEGKYPDEVLWEYRNNTFEFLNYTMGDG